LLYIIADFAEKHHVSAAVYHRDNAVQKLNQSLLVRQRLCAASARPYCADGESGAGCGVIVKTEIV
jgi:hypothetical protein